MWFRLDRFNWAIKNLEITTPGRICLFGEHQDYLGLPVIAMAISLRANISGDKRSDRQVIIHKPDIEEIERFSLDDLSYNKPRDYFKSAINICHAEGLTFSNGFECEINSGIPIKAGTSSSSAITVSWIHFLSHMADERVNWDKQKLGELAYKAEVTEFQVILFLNFAVVFGLVWYGPAVPIFVDEPTAEVVERWKDRANLCFPQSRID